ncbi:hypothetical protein HRbin27_01913 [bacterium HR27]|nr:hypothetical protein HRbin27_01913 [bacterium HR27]
MTSSRTSAGANPGQFRDTRASSCRSGERNTSFSGKPVAGNSSRQRPVTRSCAATLPSAATMTTQRDSCSSKPAVLGCRPRPGYWPTIVSADMPRRSSSQAILQPTRLRRSVLPLSLSAASAISSRRRASSRCQASCTLWQVAQAAACTCQLVSGASTARASRPIAHGSGRPRARRAESSVSSAASLSTPRHRAMAASEYPLADSPSASRSGTDPG